MNLSKVDLNLLIYLDTLLQKKNVSRAAEEIGITQPAMSNALKKLRDLFDDPLLVRSSAGMEITERALEIQPRLRQILSEVNNVLQPRQEFNPFNSSRVFRIMATDYAEATLLAPVVKAVRSEAPNVILDFLTPSDVNFKDMEQGKVDMAINRFDDLPQSFHQITVWKDNFSCIMKGDHHIADNFNLKTYLAAQHVWVSKTGMGVGFGINPEKLGGLGWIDQALHRIGQKRDIKIFTRHYQTPGHLIQNNDLIATLPSRIAKQHAESFGLAIKEPPFYIPEFELKMAWSPLLHHNAGHRWLRRLIQYVAGQL